MGRARLCMAVCVAAASFSVGCAVAEPGPSGNSIQMLNEDQALTIPFTLTRQSTFEIAVSRKQGPAIDVYVLDEQGLNAWTARASNSNIANVPYLPSLSMAPLSYTYTRRGVLPPGNYAIVIDNSDFGATAPPFNGNNDPALIEYAFTNEY
ncbi:MAG: hypothetical protein ACXW3D_09140 [Caulobacteraceae bacterium]